MVKKRLSTLTAIIALVAILMLSPAVFSQERININTADAEQLIQLRGIGEALAQRIIEFREQNGGFTSAEDIMQVRGIGAGLYERIKEKITV